MASSDWIEVQRLAAEFQRAQLSSALQKYKLLADLPLYRVLATQKVFLFKNG